MPATELIDALLREGESTCLDFKRDQYPFVGASDEQKSELLKDLLAFANAWRRTDAYILIGVEEQGGGLPRVVGVQTHIDDSQLQQFVNSKTQRTLEFSYQPMEYAGRQIGVIHIPVQTRPTYLRRSFARLATNTVYIRQGSSTAIADPDEIFRMGAASVPDVERPKLSFGFSDAKSEDWLGSNLQLVPLVLTPLSSPAVRKTPYPVMYNPLQTPHYYERLIDYTRHLALLRDFRLAVRNDSGAAADAVMVEIEIAKTENIIVVDEYGFPDRPRPNIQLVPPAPYQRPTADVKVQELANRWKVSWDAGKVRPGAKLVSKFGIYLGATESAMIEADVTIYSQELSPLRIPAQLIFRPVKRAMTREDLLPLLQADGMSWP